MRQPQTSRRGVRAGVVRGPDDPHTPTPSRHSSHLATQALRRGKQPFPCLAPWAGGGSTWGGCSRLQEGGFAQSFEPTSLQLPPQRWRGAWVWAGTLGRRTGVRWG